MAQIDAYDLYYPYELLRRVQNLEKTDWVFQQFENEIKCLVCTSSQRERETFDEDELEDHINGSEHENNFNNMIYVAEDEDGDCFNASYLSIYHESWNEYSIQLQMHQIYFSPYDEDFTLCDICEVKLSYSAINLCVHINGSNHLSNLSKDGALPWANNQIMSPKIYYPFELLITVMGIEKTNLSLNIQKVNTNYFYCLVCDIECHLNNLESHIEGRNHQDRIEEERWNIYCYHWSWKNIYSGNFQHQQKHFAPYDDDNAFCKVCERVINYNGLKGHCNGWTHRNKLNA